MLAPRARIATTREDGIVNWTVPARVIHDQIRGLHPWPHAFRSSTALSV